MRRAVMTAFAGAMILGHVASAPGATAQSVPLPVPAPRPKIGTLPPTLAEAPRAAAAAPAAATQPSAAPVQQAAQAQSAPQAVPATPAQPAATPAAAPAPSSSGPLSSIPELLGFGKPAAKLAKPGESIAFDAAQRAMVDRVSQYLSSVQTLVGNFVQIGPDGKRTEGKFYIQKPGRVRFEYAPPTPIDVIADGQSVVVRDRKLATQDLYPLSQTPLRFLLSEHIDLLKDTTLVGVSSDDVFVTVVIEEKQALIGTNRLMLMFGAKDFQLRQWTVTDPQGFDTTVAVYNLDSTKKPDPGLFKINYERMLQ
jgi:outer membrane lipoprotein-sorting protein